ncbi:13445_t:CDS:2 [Dentiscutata erythropus]|uniref:13445_t:CDS:1 n=1 Tax=Dentiscutata erythropus TaxID=1348616 RepID=A0A9N9A4M6_9GLOM|nr:13445_t:CDS:2 [Dentiscutata erythropus]
MSLSSTSALRFGADFPEVDEPIEKLYKDVFSILTLVIAPTDQWLNRSYPNNKGLAIKIIKQQLQTNSFDKEKTKAKEILKGLLELGL